MRPAVHRTIAIVDVARFGDRRRTNEHHQAVRDGLYSALRQALERIGVPWGRFDHEDRGDGIFLLLPSDIPKSIFVEDFPAELVAALHAHDVGRPEEERIRLRLALHAGEVVLDDHGATSAAVIQAFRLLDAPELKRTLSASDGVLAIVASAWFFEEVVRHNAASRPESYRQIRAQVKETDTPAWIRLPEQPVAKPGGTGAPLQTLPRDTSMFTGRQEELNRLLAATSSVDPRQVVAIHAIDGMAGVGKTTFAVHLAHRLADRYPNGQLFVRLHAYTPGQRPADPADLLFTLLSTAGVATQHIPAGLDARAAAWRDHLVGRRMLLVLDDAASHQQVEPFLPSSHGCLPLAISLVASRLKHHDSWSAADLAADLTQARGRLLEIQAEDVAVAAAFDLSYRKLPPDQRNFLCHLGMHPGLDLDAYGTAALADIPLSDARDQLEALYDNHLLDEPTPGRFRMHDLVRDYTHIRAQQDLPGADEPAVARLLQHYQDTTGVAEDYIYGRVSPGADDTGAVDTIVDVSTALAWLRTERANLVASMEYAARHGQHQQVVGLQDALTSFMWVTGPWDQGILLQQIGEGHRDDPPSRAFAFSRRGGMLSMAGNFTGAIDAYTRALEIYRSLDRPELRKRMANTLSSLGIAQLVVGEVRSRSARRVI